MYVRVLYSEFVADSLKNAVTAVWSASPGFRLDKKPIAVLVAANSFSSPSSGKFSTPVLMKSKPSQNLHA